MTPIDQMENKKIPVLPTRKLVLFPGQSLPIIVVRPFSAAAIRKAVEGDGWIVAVAQKMDHDQRPRKDELYRVGTLCRIDKINGSEEEGYQVLLTGVRRFRLDGLSGDHSYETQGTFWDDDVDLDEETASALIENLKKLTTESLSYIPGNTRRLEQIISDIDDGSVLSYLIAQNMDLELSAKQELLEEVSLKRRYLKLLDDLLKQKEQLKIRHDVGRKINDKMTSQQRKALIQEQIRALQQELKEGDGEEGEGEDLAKRVKDAGMPEDVEEIALKQLERLESLSEQSPETNIIRSYLEYLCDMPWKKADTPPIDLAEARRILDGDHSGMDKVKQRIIEHLAVMKLKNDKKGSILLLEGPPGVGKTSLGKSIAKALGRKFVRASLGGVRDEAEVRGHRRTYIGAMAGRIVDGIKRAGENNPVFVLDEIDKLGQGFAGDPASALLEVLDPEQNHAFVDHYMDVPYDLSDVFFVATANNLATIPQPLLDRMEVIRLTGYTEAEKLHISHNYLVPKQLEEHGLKPEQLVISEEAQKLLIAHYTREAGVRNLQRQIAALVRGSAERVLQEEAELPVQVGEDDVKRILGPEKFIPKIAELQAPPGVVTGLAWTPVGGEILFIEATHMKGKGGLTLTGQLGDVMKESTQIALSLIRSRLAAHAPEFRFDRSDIHLHVPSGAIPKDGPSAGVAMLTTIASLVTGRRVDPKWAMTGEITLRGAVLPVGGIKEKLVAAHRAGIERVFLSSKNQRDLFEVPEEVKEGLEITFVDDVDQLLALVLDLEPGPGAKIDGGVSTEVPLAS